MTDYSADALHAAHGPTMTADTAAELLGVSRSGVYRLMKTGDLPSVELGRLRRVLTRGVADKLNPESSTAAPEPESAA